MDWSPFARYGGAIRILVGVLLLLNPLVVAEFDLGDPDWYRYEAAEVPFDEDGIDVPIEVDDVDPDVACLERLPRRSCMLELAVHERGGLTFDGLPESFVDTGYRYVYDYGEGFFEPVAEERNGSVRYGLEPVPREVAMDDASTDVERAPPGVRRAIRTGRVETSDELPGANELVRADGEYHVVYRAAARTTTGDRAAPVVALQWMSGVVGLALVLRGQTVRVERRLGYRKSTAPDP